MQQFARRRSTLRSACALRRRAFRMGPGPTAKEQPGGASCGLATSRSRSGFSASGNGRHANGRLLESTVLCMWTIPSPTRHHLRAQEVCTPNKPAVRNS